MWFLQAGTVTDYQNQLALKTQALAKTKATMGSVKAASEKEKKILSEDCESLEEQIGSVTEKLKELGFEITALEQAIEDEEANLAIIEKEATGLPQQLADLNDALSQAKANLTPLKDENATVGRERLNLETQLRNLQAVNDDLQAKLNALRAERAKIQNIYDERSRALFQRIDKPPWRYYGDKLQIKLYAVPHPMVSVFMALSRKDVHKGMEFLVRRLNPPEPTQRSWRFKVTLVEGELCIASIMPGFGDQSIDLLAGEEVQLERSGKLVKQELEEPLTADR